MSVKNFRLSRQAVVSLISFRIESRDDQSLPSAQGVIHCEWFWIAGGDAGRPFGVENLLRGACGKHCNRPRYGRVSFDRGKPELASRFDSGTCSDCARPSAHGLLDQVDLVPADPSPPSSRQSPGCRALSRGGRHLSHGEDHRVSGLPTLVRIRCASKIPRFPCSQPRTCGCHVSSAACTVSGTRTAPKNPHRC